jgi:DNA-binding transcriptional ArsR family regulator
MSHKAVNWALEQRHLKAGPWIVLIQLADRHNKDTRKVCPHQSTIATDCNMSRSTVNLHLNGLEKLGLIIRVERQDRATKRQLATHYILQPDFTDLPDVDNAVSDYRTRVPTDQNGNTGKSRVQKPDTENSKSRVRKNTGAVSDSRVRNSDTKNHVIHNHGKEPCVDEPHTQFDFSDFLEKFKTAYPRLGDPDATANELQQAIDAGTDPDRIISGARAYADEQRGNNRQYIAFSENWIRLKRWERYAAGAKKASQSEIDVFTADLIRRGRPELVRHVSPTRAAWMVDAGLVTAADCKKAGIRL